MNSRPLMATTLASLALFCAGCASFSSANSDDTENLLIASGFKTLPADTELKKAKLAELQPNAIARQLRGDKTHYLYADNDRNFLLVGDEMAYAKYVKLVTDIQQREADKQQAAWANYHNALQNQQMINAYNYRTQTLSQPINVNVYDAGSGLAPVNAPPMPFPAGF